MKRGLIRFSLIALPLLVASTAFAQQKGISYFRSYDKRGINVFETPKTDTIPFTGLKVRIGGNFTQSFQSLDHSNKALPNIDPVSGADRNKLLSLTPGFNTAVANLNIDVQLADGVRMNLITYLSSRHHQETWVKGGYIQFDRLPFLNSDALDKLMEYTTIKVGHMEINYGDGHFRRSDNGNALYNPFIENYILDAFTTEIGGEIYFQNKGMIAMLGIAGGEIKGDVLEPAVVANDDKAKKSPSFYGKLGYDKQLTEDFRLRVTGSAYHTASSVNNVLYGGDRAGSHYYFVMENQSTTSQFYSGRLQPGFKDKVTALTGNVFMKYRGLEFFGTYENAKGRAQNETSERTVDQVAAELVYRFGSKENVFVGARYNNVNAEVAGIANEVSINRMQLGAGWFITKNLLLKGEYVNQKYLDYPNTSILHEGKFNGFVVEAIVGF
ncbi:MAG TPA: hypothetical protein PLC17_07650 [Tenuifilaceae bacterium]|nr:hypothetical protein [Tenuifilaceae bacterium]